MLFMQANALIHVNALNLTVKCNHFLIGNLLKNTIVNGATLDRSP